MFSLPDDDLYVCLSVTVCVCAFVIPLWLVYTFELADQPQFGFYASALTFNTC